MGCSPENGQLIGEAVELPSTVPGIDALLTAHSHQKLAGEIKGIPVTQAAYNGRAVASIRLLYSPMQQKVIKGLPKANDLGPANLTEDPDVAAIIKSYKPEVKSLEEEIIGKNVYMLSHDRFQVSPLGCWVADTVRQAVAADIALINGGSLRTDLLAGNISMGHILGIMPFDNYLVLQEMKGEDIIKVLEYGIKNSKYGSIQFSGLKVSYNAAKPEGQRVTSVTLPDNKPLIRDKSYRVATNDFTAGGGDGYTMFKEAGTPQVNTKQLVRDVVIDQIKKSSTVAFKDDQRLIEAK
jgi:2',3'-cyclic-nucleotide 2'-phosphodiesterase/3'-nucleotidase